MASSQPGCFCQSLRSSNTWNECLHGRNGHLSSWVHVWNLNISDRAWRWLAGEEPEGSRHPNLRPLAWRKLHLDKNTHWWSVTSLLGKRPFSAFHCLWHGHVWIPFHADICIYPGWLPNRRTKLRCAKAWTLVCLWALHSKETTVTFGHVQFVTFHECDQFR